MDFLSRAGGRHCFILEKDKDRKDQKNLRRKLVDLILPETGLSQATNLETRKQNKVDRNEQITSKDVFPKRSVKMTDGTEKPKIPLTFATKSRKQSFRISGVCDVINSNCLIYLLNRLSFLSVQ